MSACPRALTLVAALALSMLGLSFGAVAEAHVRTTTGYAELQGQSSDVAMTLSLDYDVLVRAVGLGSDAIAAQDDSARARVLEQGADQVAAYVRERMTLFVDGAACASSLGSTAVERRQGTPYARLDLGLDCPGNTGGSYRLDYDVFSETDAVVDDNTTLVEYELGGEKGRGLIDRAHPRLTIGDGSALGTTKRFLMMGSEHILFGLDHVLFVVALLLGSRRVKDVVTLATVFTLAHSVTLLVTALGLVEPPGRLVEPLIALSIVFVALDNLLSTRPTHKRWAVVFAFGLLHGLGFGSSLRVSDDFSWGLLGSLLSFNVGIELGQGLLLLTVFPVLLRLHRSRWSTHVLTATTLAVAVVALIWFFERVDLG